MSKVKHWRDTDYSDNMDAPYRDHPYCGKELGGDAPNMVYSRADVTCKRCIASAKKLGFIGVGAIGYRRKT